MNDWLTTILIVLPVAGALLVAVAPLSTYWLGSLAALVSLVEVGFWITPASKFDFGSPQLQFSPADAVDPRPERQLARRPVRVLAVVRRHDRGRDGGVHDLRLVGRAATAAAPTSRSCCF